MAELIEAACDICGQLYRWSEERLNETAVCRECGTKFEVQRYTPPPDEVEGDLDNPLPWIKGACVAAIIIAALGGLGSLLTYRPGSRPFPTANTAPGYPAPSYPAPAYPVPNYPATGQSAVGQSSAGQSAPAYPAPGQPAPVIPGPAAGTGERPGACPVITGWSLVDPQQLRLTGRGLKGITRAETVLGIALIDVQFTVVSDAELLIRTVFLNRPEKLFAVSSPDGIALVVSDAIPAVDTQDSLDFTPGVVPLRLVRKGGHLVSLCPTIVLVESGGRAVIQSHAVVCFMQNGAELEAERASSLIAEPGASATLRQPFIVNNRRSPAITFCRLPAPGSTP